METKQTRISLTLGRVITAGLVGGSFVLIGLFVFGVASLYVARVRAMQDSAIAEHAEVRAAEQAELLRRLQADEERRSQSQQKRRAREDAQPDEARQARPPITLALDAQGKCEAAGAPATLDDLRVLLKGQSNASRARPSVILYVDPQCPYEHVSRVQSLCFQLDIDVALITSRSESRPPNKPPRDQTAVR